MADFDPYLSWLGIPLSQRPPTAYQLLAIDPAITDPAVIKALALQRAAYVRNFQKGEHSERCSKLLEEIAQAETTLADPAKRAAYDRSLKPVAPTAPKPTPSKPVPAVSPPKPKSASIQVVAVPVEATPKRRRTRNARRNSELAIVLGWVAGGVTLLIGTAVLVSVLRSTGEQPTAAAPTNAPSTASTATQVPKPSPTTPQDAPPSTPPAGTATLPAMATSSSYSSQPAILKFSFEFPAYDAVITIDGTPKLRTRDDFYPLSPGEHQVEIMKGRTLRFSTRVTLRAGETHECRVAMSAFKAVEVEPQQVEPPSKRVLNLPPHDPEEFVVARFFVEASTMVTLLKGKAEITHSGRLYEFKARWKEFDDGVEFHIVNNSHGRTIAIDPRIVGRDVYQAVVAELMLRDVEFARKQNNLNEEVGVTFIVVQKMPTVSVIKGNARVVQGGATFQVFGTLAAFDDGVEAEFSSPGFRPLVIRVDPLQLGTRRTFVVELVPEKSAKKPTRPKRG